MTNHPTATITVSHSEVGRLHKAVEQLVDAASGIEGVEITVIYEPEDNQP